MLPRTRNLPIILLLVLISPLYAQQNPQPNQIIEIFRHGARGPLSGYDKSWPNYEFGALTASGTRQHFILGKTLAKKYPSIFSWAYNPFQVYVLSDITVRCIQSAAAQLDGMFDHKGLYLTLKVVEIYHLKELREGFAPEVAVPPFVDPAIQETVSSIRESSALPAYRVPTVVNVVDGTNAVVFQRNRGTICPNGNKWELQNVWDNKTKEAWNIFKPTIDQVNAHLGPNQQLKGNVDVAIFGDAMLTNIYDNRTLPGNITDPNVIANFTSAFSWFVFHVEYGQLIQRQLNAYHTVEAMLDQLIAFRKGVKYHQVAMFSGHDYNLYALLAAFEIVTEECLMENFLSYAANKTTPHPHCVFPHFAANIILEFYNQTGQVKFLYNNMVIHLCGGKETCDYEEFLRVARSATGNNTLSAFQEKCGVNVTNLAVNGKSQEELLLQNEKSASEQLITSEGEENHEEDVIEVVVVYSSSSSSGQFLKIALAGMTILCLILFARLISRQRDYSLLEEEVRSRGKKAKEHEVLETEIIGVSPKNSSISSLPHNQA